MFDFVCEVNLKPISWVKLCDIRLEAIGGPLFHSLAELVLRNCHSLRPIDFGEASGKDGLCFVVERAY